MSNVSLPVDGPRCPNPECVRDHLSARKAFPAGDDAVVTCDFCGKAAPAAEWFNYESDDSGVTDMTAD